MTATNVLKEVDVASAGIEQRFRLRPRVALGAIGRPRHQDRIFAFFNRTIDVGIEDDAVTHRDGDSIVERNVVARRRGLGELNCVAGCGEEQ
jgi:hypothetical protein